MKPKKHNPNEYRSGLEQRFQDATTDLGYNFAYEQDKIKYTVPESKHSYTPDFTVTNNVYIETKGLWTAADRKKACLIREQHPEVNILYVLYRDQRLSKKSKTTYLTWAAKNGLEACTFSDRTTWVSFIQRYLNGSKAS